jgi:hypothetical protein
LRFHFQWSWTHQIPADSSTERRFDQITDDTTDTIYSFQIFVNWPLNVEQWTTEWFRNALNDLMLCRNVAMIENDKQNEPQVFCEYLIFKREWNRSFRLSWRWRWYWSSAVSSSKIVKIGFLLFWSMETILAVILDVFHLIIICFYNTAVWANSDESIVLHFWLNFVLWVCGEANLFIVLHRSKSLQLSKAITFSRQHLKHIYYLRFSHFGECNLGQFWW